MYPFLIALLIAVADQIIKFKILEMAESLKQIEIIKNFFYITYVENYGIAFGMFKYKTLFFIIANILISMAVIYMIIKYYKTHKPITICFALILGGAIGNLIDRVRLGYVVDYLYFTIFPPVFNLADSSIVIGAVLMGIIILFDKKLSI